MPAEWLPWAGLAVTVLSGLLGLIGVLLTLRAGKLVAAAQVMLTEAQAKQSDADAAATLSEAARLLVEPLRNQVQGLTADLQGYRTENLELIRTVARTEKELGALRDLSGGQEKEIEDLNITVERQSGQIRTLTSQNADQAIQMANQNKKIFNLETALDESTNKVKWLERKLENAKVRPAAHETMQVEVINKDPLSVTIAPETDAPALPDAGEQVITNHDLEDRSAPSQAASGPTAKTP